MKLINLFLGVLFYFSVSQATQVECLIEKNAKKLVTANLTTSLNQKTLIAHNETISVYLTEKEKNYFIIDAFVPELELRFYGQGHLNSLHEELTSSIWTRDLILDVTCKRVEK